MLWPHIITMREFYPDLAKEFCAMAWQAVCMQATTLVGGGKVFGHDEVHVTA